MRIGYLGAGAWGFCLANLLSEKGHEVILWTGNQSLVEVLKRGQAHPKLTDHRAEENLVLTTDLTDAVTNVDMVIESVTSKGLRQVLTLINEIGVELPPFVITSKGIEQGTGLLMCDLALEVLGDRFYERIGCLSGPSIAGEVAKKFPTSVVAASYNHELAETICQAFSTPYFSVSPCSDLRGACFGGAMKNIIAIACAISDGIGYGENTKAALLTRGLSEIRQLGRALGCRGDTLSGLSGLGDLTVTCLSKLSRNYIFGQLLASGMTPEKAYEKVGMVVEGANTCLSAIELSKKHEIMLPITEAIYSILKENVVPREAIDRLLMNPIPQAFL